MIVGRIAGSGLSSEIDASLDQADRLYAARTRQAALETRPSAVISRWQNSTTGNTGAIMPTRTYRSADAGYCRKSWQNITIAGRTGQAHGGVCRQPDGSWQIAQ